MTYRPIVNPNHKKSDFQFEDKQTPPHDSMDYSMLI